MNNAELVSLALKFMENSYSPYSGYKVGAALLCSDNTVVTGVNVENISYGATICAERTAILKAISEGKRGFAKIAVAVSGDEIGIPCGMCLQVITEFVSGDFKILSANNKGEFSEFKLSELLPTPFNAKFVNSINGKE